MWLLKYKMWRAQPLLWGATCPAGSKTSCCESFIIFKQSFSFTLLFFFCHLLFIKLPPSPSFFTPPSKEVLSLYCFAQLFLSTSTHPPLTPASSFFHRLSLDASALLKLALNLNSLPTFFSSVISFKCSLLIFIYSAPSSCGSPYFCFIACPNISAL